MNVAQNEGIALPYSLHYAVTTMFDARGQVVQWYIDICHRHWVDDHGGKTFTWIYWSS